jgi:hypothetical protein
MHFSVQTPNVMEMKGEMHSSGSIVMPMKKDEIRFVTANCDCTLCRRGIGTDDLHTSLLYASTTARVVELAMHCTAIPVDYLR